MVGVEKVVWLKESIDLMGNRVTIPVDGPINVPVGIITLKAIRTPSSGTSELDNGGFPTDQPVWSMPTKPAGAYVPTMLPTGATAEFVLDQPGSYVFTATCGTSSKSITVDAVTGHLEIVGVPEGYELTTGGFLVRRADGNNAPRVPIVLHAEAESGNVILTRSSPKVKIFTEANGGVEITFNGTDNKFPMSQMLKTLSKTLYAEGADGSAYSHDVTLMLTFENSDYASSACFTVLWVTVSARHDPDEEVSNDNSAKEQYKSIGIPPSANLGYRLRRTVGVFHGRASEFIGEVKPSDFRPHEDFEKEMRLTREVVGGKMYYGTKENIDPPKPDLSLEAYRDNDPQSGGSSGKIYDIDAPGSTAISVSDLPDMETGLTIRDRTNFRYWAEIDGIRCSEKKEWYSRQSYKLTGPFEAGTATSSNTNMLEDTSKVWSTDIWSSGVVYIKKGTGKGQFRNITGNAPSWITVSPNWAVSPDATSEYVIINTSSWTLLNDVPGDNKNDDGSTNTTWNLE